ncbi:AraC family transcriptional regulator [Methylocella sp. CPCC 101449]|jgi:AraC-like DNA-binding protein|uniref:AraC family transcriptional regulator n=1 Tax=Methylocella sp. CPCC 101449 TaxID=2987531 RepID=UPI00288EC286|nr:AraC family transcriptional regulator [Methylocella sp. CPCC 101449]MDT2022054.1 AraC family transcriptional regulator [Methylocella sp. CPCC 101449]HEV2572163.1 AraC family transcriptional regulator [Beijerinckiaceae bacterium]
MAAVGHHMSPAVPLARYTRVDTRDPGAAEAEVGRIFCAHRLTPTKRGAPYFRAVHNNAQHDGFSINYVAYGADVEIDPGRLDRFFLLQIPLIGGADVRCGQSTVEASLTHASLLSPTLPTLMRWREGTQKLIVLIDRHVVERHATALLDRAIERIEFDVDVAVEAPAGAAMRAQALLMQSLSERAGRSPERWSLAHRQLRDSLIGLMLAAQPHNHAQALAQPASAAAPAHVRKAEDYLEAHADGPLAADDIAAAAGVGLRTLQAGFRQFRNKTLTEAILDARLNRWRTLLSDPDQGQGAGDLALTAGLLHHGRATAAYRRRYGENPSDTRRMAQLKRR